MNTNEYSIDLHYVQVDMNITNIIWTALAALAGRASWDLNIVVTCFDLKKKIISIF